MEDDRKSLIVTALIGLIVVVLIGAGIFYLFKYIQSRRVNVASNSQTKQTSVVDSSRPQTGNTNSEDIKTYNGDNFQVKYPKNWGLLTCSNSKNIEFDPTDQKDQKILCDSAVKPITVIVGESPCAGQTVKLGNVEAVKQVSSDESYTSYKWCTKTQPVLFISHRVTKGNDLAASKEDFSKQVEDLISKITFSANP